MNKIAIVTSKIGKRESSPLKEQINKYDNVDYHAFVDTNISSNTWQIHRPLNFSSDSVFQDRRNAKIYKVLPFLFLPNYDYYIWIDSTHDILMDPHEIVNKMNKDIMVFKHGERNCIYQEAQAIKYLRYDYQELVDKQMFDYSMNGFPENNGLFELPTFVVKNTEKVREIMLCWWEHICKYTSRDQLSFPYVLWLKKYEPQILPGIAQAKNDFFQKTLPTSLSTRV
jgi:hypothetical protein